MNATTVTVFFLSFLLILSMLLMRIRFGNQLAVLCLFSLPLQIVKALTGSFPQVAITLSYIFITDMHVIWNHT